VEQITPADIHPGGRSPNIVQLSKPGSVTRLASVGLTEAKSKEAAKAEIRQQAIGVSPVF
jgi:hypothetical protein